MTKARHDRKLAAFFTVLAAVGISSSQDTFIKYISGNYPFHEMQTIRCGVSMLVPLVYVAVTEGLGALAVRNWRLLSLRGFIFALASITFYLTAAAMSLPEAVALYFTMPLFVALLAGPFLGERVTLPRLLAVLLGFAGVIVMQRPGAGVFEPAALVGLSGSLFYAIGNMLTRPLGGTISAGVMGAYQSLFYFVTAAALALWFGPGGHEMTGHPSLVYLSRGWVMPATPDLALMLGLGVATGFLYILYSLAYRLADSSFVAPFEYTAMIWAIGLSFLVFGTLPDRYAVAGIAIIVAAGLFMLLADRYSRSRVQKA